MPLGKVHEPTGDESKVIEFTLPAFDPDGKYKLLFSKTSINIRYVELKMVKVPSNVLMSVCKIEGFDSHAQPSKLGYFVKIPALLTTILYW